MFPILSAHAACLFTVFPHVSNVVSVWAIPILSPHSAILILIPTFRSTSCSCSCCSCGFSATIQFVDSVDVRFAKIVSTKFLTRITLAWHYGILTVDCKCPRRILHNGRDIVSKSLVTTTLAFVEIVPHIPGDVTPVYCQIVVTILSGLLMPVT